MLFYFEWTFFISPIQTFNMPVAKLDMSKFKTFSDPAKTRAYFQSLAHVAEAAERYEGKFVFTRPNYHVKHTIPCK